MKGKNIVFVGRSIDGYIAGKDGELDWLDKIPNPDGDDMGYNNLMEEIDAIVMGRNTFEVVLDFGGEWPYSKPVFVLSNTLEFLPKRLEQKVFLIKGSPQEVLLKIHRQGYTNLYIDGGRTVQDFLKQDLIDELRLSTIPVLLGGGIPLFGELPQLLDFEYVKSEVFLGQITQDCFRRKRKGEMK